LLCGCLPRACDQKAAAPAQKAPALPTVSLRFRPMDKVGYREHWVYDMAVPGTGVARNALSLDVDLLAKLDDDAFAVRQTIRAHRMLQNSKPVPMPSLEGASITYSWRHDHSLVSEITADAKDPTLAAMAKLTAQLARFGTLIEYPDQPVAVGDAWSIEPQRLMVAPGLEATLRPSYTLQSIDKQGPDREAVIATDMQVDVVSVPVGEGITVEGGGTASGTLRVRVRDGQLLEARSVMHFSQEITVQGSEILGYRELSATTHVFTTGRNVQPDLAAEPYSIEKPEDDRDCDLQLGSALQRFRTTPSHQRAYVLSALRGLLLPQMPLGEIIEEPGVGIVLSADGKRVEIDGSHVDSQDMGRVLRAAVSGATGIFYLYADAKTPLEHVRAVLALLPAHAQAKLAVRDGQVLAPTPKIPHWQDVRLRRALAAPTMEEREKQLNDLLLAHLMLCEPAVMAFHNALLHPDAWPALEAVILRAYLTCGCTATNLDALETTLQAIFGSPELRAVPLPRALDERLSGPTATVSDLARWLTPTPKAKSKPASTAAASSAPK
jgi:hypothetical protein